jgi:ribonuclease P protein component
VLAADQRLRHRDAFRRTVRSGRRAGGPALVVHLLAGDADPALSSSADSSPRVGLVVSRAVGSSVVRNLVKRRLRHVVKNHLTELPRSSTLVVRALPASAALSSAELDAELARCLRRVGTADPQPATRSGSVIGAES